MKRREFAKLTGLSAVAISTTGFIRFDGTSFIGDCETTSDILGPFYRPDSPVRNNLVIAGTNGDLVELTGIVRHKDCHTPYANAKVELWHCSADEIYDNDSDEFRYRGTTYCDADGKYQFTTQMPVPYDAGGGLIRPAHFHMMISAPGYQSLITQIYFQGDPHLQGDSSSGAPEAAGRILPVTERRGIKRVSFDCNMNDRLKASCSALNAIVGKYRNDENGKIREFFAKDDLLWMKNEVFGQCYEYAGENTFAYAGLPTGSYMRLHFELIKGGAVKLKLSAKRESGEEFEQMYSRI